MSKVLTEGVAEVKGGVSNAVRSIRIGASTQSGLERALVAVLTGNDQDGVTMAVPHICGYTPDECF